MLNTRINELGGVEVKFEELDSPGRGSLGELEVLDPFINDRTTQSLDIPARMIGFNASVLLTLKNHLSSSFWPELERIDLSGNFIGAPQLLDLIGVSQSTHTAPIGGKRNSQRAKI